MYSRIVLVLAVLLGPVALAAATSDTSTGYARDHAKAIYQCYTYKNR